MLSTYSKKQLDLLLNICRRNLSSRRVNEHIISKAFRFAYDAHRNEKRASGEPYFSHPYQVAMIIAKDIPLDDISVASALLHDVVEDTKFSIKDIKAEFGEEIAEIVDGATKIENISANYEQNLVDSYKKMLLSMTTDLRVIVVKFADRLHNLRTLQYLNDSRQIMMAQETLEIYAPLAHRFGLSNVKTELENLSFKYIDQKMYEDIAKKVKDKVKESDAFIKRFIKPIKDKLSEENYRFEIYGRAKHIYSIYRKMKYRGKSFNEIYDLLAVRIILDSDNSNDCFQVYGLCAEIYKPVPEQFKDYISLPKINGYQSIHTTLVSNEGRMVEVQIRTRQMHEIAEKGIAAHWKYKEKTNINDKNIEQWMKEIRETFESAGKDDITSKQLLDNFRLNLYQDEIFCFTPKGELKIMPAGSTPLDFAFEIHSQVGMRCIGAKVNGRIVQLDVPLKSGSQIEIITSKTSAPKRDWEKFVTTQKARSVIRRYFNAEKRKVIAEGKELFEKKIKKNKIHINKDELLRIAHKLKYRDLPSLYYEAGKDESKADEIFSIISDKNRMMQFEKMVQDKETDTVKSATDKLTEYVNEVRAGAKGLIIGKGDSAEFVKGIKYEFAKCCNPIPGDEVIGFVTQSEGIKVHRKNCRNIINLFLKEPARVIEIRLDESGTGDFTGGIKIIGEDKPGMLNEITKALLKNYKINIRSINFSSKGSVFEGTIILSVENLKQLNEIIEKINSQEGIFSATRI